MKENLISDKNFPFRHFTTTKSCGNMKNETERNNLLASAGLDKNKLVLAKQVHGVNIHIASKDDAGTFIENCDGLITKEKDVALGIFTADCMPVLMVSRDGSVKAAVHAGWRGLAGGILQNAVKIFKENFGVKAGDIYAYIGPHIRQCCYEVSPDLEEVFGIKLKSGKFDMSRTAKKILKKEGFLNIAVSGHCSCCEDTLFFSYRKDKTESRMITLID